MYSLIKIKKSPYYQLLLIQKSGKRTTISTKTKIKSEALKFLTQFKEEEIGKKQTQSITLEELKNIYSDYAIMKYSKSYIRTSDLAFRILIKKFDKDTLLKDMTVPALETFFLERYGESKSGAHLNYRTLKAIFEKAVEWNYIIFNPMKKIRMPKMPHNNVLAISDEEFIRILNQEPKGSLRLFYEIGRGTGMRLSEIINLKWNQIDWAGKLIRVLNSEGFTTKNKKERVIPMSSRVNEILTFLRPQILNINFLDDLIFKNDNGIIFQRDFVTKRFKKCIRRADVNPRYHFHNLRSTFASDLIQKGVSIFIVQKLLGHSSVAVTERNYAHLQTETLKTAINLL